MNARLLVLILLSSLIIGCSNPQHPRQARAFSADVEHNQREKTKYLAYEHSLIVEIEKSELQKKYDELISFCSKDTEHDCTILDSSISISDNTSSAKVKLRVKPAGVEGFIVVVSKKGEIAYQSTKIDDLAKEVIDTEKRRAMLSAHRERLIELQQLETTDIDALLKIAKELALVQSELEQAVGKEQHLLKRINMDLINITYKTDRDREFWSPIKRASKGFLYELSNGVSSVIAMVAYSIPYFLVFIAVLVITIKVWKRAK